MPRSFPPACFHGVAKTDNCWTCHPDHAQPLIIEPPFGMEAIIADKQRKTLPCSMQWFLLAGVTAVTGKVASTRPPQLALASHPSSSLAQALERLLPHIRCWKLGPQPARVIGTCDPRLKNFDVTAWRTGKPLCPVGSLYSELLNQTIDRDALRRLQTLTDFQVAVTRLPRGLSPSLGAAIGVGVYQLEKKLFQPVHPKFGRALGFRPEFVAARSLNDPQQLRDALMASSGVPPFMPVTKVGDLPAFDGGLVDNVPVEPLLPVEAEGGRTLVLLTRIYRSIPAVKGRTYVQPSQKIDVKQFDITNPDGIRSAFELGLKDGDTFAVSLGR